MATNLIFMKALVANIMNDKARREWTVQGFGFLRTYFGPPETPKQFRLNLWDSKFTIPNVSTIHDHPWDFSSIIIAGELKNKKYEIWEENKDTPTHKFATLKTGVGGSLDISTEKECYLALSSVINYKSGEVYSQKANEIHETTFKDGTVTLNRRIGDTEQARVFWDHKNNWIDAIPRLATKREIDQTIDKSLGYWF